MVEVVAVLFLIISVTSLIVQSVALYRITRDTAPKGIAYSGIRRTAICRVVASVLYTMLGISSLIDAAVVENLLVFGVVQVVWQLNAIADVGLRRRLSRPGPKHLRPPPVSPPIARRAWFGASLLAMSLAFVGYLILRH